ncbi:ANTAR domain-containing protein [Streptomyces sp. 21So2-11]|uniref:ANTAR domain-containing protein n=1 Tax=Streptomyces sp. 21So2-11 TaxID=3144408 RepID=UPI003219F751
MPTRDQSAATTATAELRSLREEVAQLKQAVASHADVDQAIGVICAVGQLTPDQAWEVLVEVSQHTNTKVRSVADRLVEWTCEGSLPPDIEVALKASMARQSPCGEPG